MSIEELKSENDRLISELKALKELAKEYELDSIELSFLEGGGVDNWCGYDESMQVFNEFIENDFKSEFDT